MRRTTLEIDGELLERAKAALGCSTMKATVEEALRLAVARAEDELADRRRRQRAFLDRLDVLGDLEVLRSEAMWR